MYRFPLHFHFLGHFLLAVLQQRRVMCRLCHECAPRYHAQYLVAFFLLSFAAFLKGFSMAILRQCYLRPTNYLYPVDLSILLLQVVAIYNCSSRFCHIVSCGRHVAQRKCCRCSLCWYTRLVSMIIWR